MENRPKLNDKGEWRCATIHRMGRRLPGWDYRRERKSGGLPRIAREAARVEAIK